MRLLRQENAEIEHNGDKFNLIGVDYQRDHMTSGAPTGPMLSDAAHLVRRDVPNILLSHNPNSFRRAAELGVELSLAGHTHGGQVQFEIVDHRFTPARLITDFVAGLYHLPFSNGAAHASEKKWRPARTGAREGRSCSRLPECVARHHERSSARLQQGPSRHARATFRSSAHSARATSIDYRVDEGSRVRS